MKIRFYIALLLGKLSIPALKLTNHNATDFPGWLALKICPEFIKYVDKPKEFIAITGTDGKTTCTNLAYELLSKTGKKILTNIYGSNINSGISTSLLKGVNIFNKSQYEMAVLEVDERSSLRIYPFFHPTIVVCINLFRDSIMRNGHPQYISDFVHSALPEDTKLILNGDDFFCVELAPKNPRKYFGVCKLDRDVIECENRINDFQICPKCHSKLVYDYRHYHHIGKAHCSNCDYQSPNLDYEVIKINEDSIVIKDKESIGTYKLISDSLHNIYNMVTIVALAREYGLDHQTISEYFKDIKITKTRYQEEHVCGIDLKLHLTKDKNALACSRVFDYLSTLPDKKELYMMMCNKEDEKEWSENTCWLYDCDFEFLAKANVTHIVAVGPRCNDYRLRLNIAGIDNSIIDTCMDEKDGTKLLKCEDGVTIYELHGASAGDIEFANDVKDRIIKRIKEVHSC